MPFRFAGKRHQTVSMETTQVSLNGRTYTVDYKVETVKYRREPLQLINV